MNHLDYHRIIEYLKELLKKEAKISPKELAHSFMISERTIIRLISNLRLDGLNIKFDRKAHTYRLN